MGIREVGSILWRTIGRFRADGAERYGAALAFYATLSLAPLLLLVVSVVSLLARDGTTERVLIDQLSRVMGERGVRVAADILAAAPDEDSSILGMIGSAVLLLLGGSVLFMNVQGTLNAMWNVRRRSGSMLRSLVRSRLIAFLMILAGAGVLLVSAILGAAAAWAAPLVERELAIGSTIVVIAELAVSATVITLLCAAIYHILPDVEIAWRDVWLGAVVTAVLFLIGRAGIAWYLNHAAVASRFGAAGSLVAFLVWVYYSAQIFFFGAEFTQVWAERRGVPIMPSEGAVRVERRELEPTRR